MADEKERMREKATQCFEEADVDQSGALTPFELAKVVQAIGLQKSADEVQVCMVAYSGHWFQKSVDDI
jgi:Ca2+-binding EF-hand superfamily protein